MSNTPENISEHTWPERVVIDSALAISRITAKDASDFYSAVDANRDHLSEYMEWAAHYNPEQALHDCLTLEADMKKDTGAAYKIEYEDEFVGSVTLGNRQHNEAELSIWLTDDALGKHIASKSAREVVKYGFSNWNLAAVILHIEAGNSDSQNFAARIGAHKILTATPGSGNYEIWEIINQEFKGAE